ncbi:MAG: helix-turn-helix domain-containing protein, partial [Pseudomonadota bacterium]
PILANQIKDADGQFDELHSWITANLTEDLKVERLAEHVGMSARNFARVYLAATGQTPAKSVELIRLTAARTQLEDTEDPVSVVAQRTGFMDKERLRRAMQRSLGLSPSQYRQHFGA